MEAETTAEQASAFWPSVLRQAPDYTRYPKRTDRPIPLVRLSAVGENAPQRGEAGAANGFARDARKR